MITEENVFGSGDLYQTEDLSGSVYSVCTACMSILSEHQSWMEWVNKYEPTIKITLRPEEADHLIVLSCQVTELAILNDLRTLEALIRDYPGKQYYIGGCLARRFDIPMPDGVKRVGNLRRDYQDLGHKEKPLEWAQPFWVKNYSPVAGELQDGHLFRDMYPLRIGVGCKQNCAYCSIKHTRGEGYELETERLKSEFLQNDDVVLIADSPSKTQLVEWCETAILYNKPISIRNVEPRVLMEIRHEVRALAADGVLNTLHVPIQSDNPDVLKNMHRSTGAVEYLLSWLPGLRKYGVILATNVIIDYKDFPNPDMDALNNIFDYISWNPYWDGKWDRTVAEERFEKYFGSQ